MNRLSNYFESAKLAKIFLTQAQERVVKKDPRALQSAVEAMGYMVVAMNNVASIAFNHKPRRKK